MAVQAGLDARAAGRRLPVGAEPQGDGVHFRVWAPKRRQVDLVLDSQAARIALDPEEGGYFAGHVAGIGAGARYRFLLDGEDGPFPDPASRFQPEGPHGPSEVVDPHSFVWSDQGWPGLRLEGQVIYELHLGTFTPEGNWAGAMAQLEHLAELGITAIEIMPVADFPGRFGWGYDGVAWFAPAGLYGTPDDFRRFVDRAHSVGLGVILDVVYNHFGPSGNYLPQFSDSYFTDRYATDWGQAINYDGPGSAGVREFAIANARYWIGEFHCDGLRLDATQQIFDNSAENILAALTAAARRTAAPRSIIVVGENEPQDARLVRPPAEGGFGLDALWNDDLHHTAMVALAGRNEGYYADYKGSPQEFVSAAKHGFLYQGQYYKWQKQRRGTRALDLPPARFVTFLQNHDQVANSGTGQRCHEVTSLGRYRALTAYVLLCPGTPMLFQGQEFASSAPFQYFADHDADLAALVREGRRAFLEQFPSLATPDMRAQLPAPDDPATFARCKLDFAERERHAAILALHRDLLALRRSDPAFAAQTWRGVDGAVLAAECFVLRFFTAGGMDRLLLVNLGPGFELDPAPEPLLAPPPGCSWRVLLSTEAARYGGSGAPALEDSVVWRIPAHAASALLPSPEDTDQNQ